jgi:carbonic anhydrase
VQSVERRPSTPREALEELLAGNERFVAGSGVHPNQDAERRAALASEQAPFAVVFGCSDSRLAAEIVFDRGLGDLFVVRTAGHIVGPEVLASIEYGVRVLGVPLVVVLGHDSCGAVQAAYDAATGASTPPGLRPIVDRVRPSLPPDVDKDADLDAISASHVRLTVVDLRSHLALDEDAVVGMTYRLGQGRVTVLR